MAKRNNHPVTEQLEDVEDTTEAPVSDSEDLEAVEDQNPTEGEETPEDGADGVSEGDSEDDTEETPEDDPEGDPEGDTFPRAYVEKLRKQAADARVRAQKATELSEALWEARVAATGRLADPTDLALPDDADPLDPEAVTAAVDELLARKPHLASRVPRGNVGAGVQHEAAEFSLGGMIRAAAR